MTQPAADPIHAVLRAGYANPLTLDIKVTDDSYVKVYVDSELLDSSEYTIDGIGSDDGIEITITDFDDDFFPDAVYITAVFEPPIEQGADLSAGGAFGRAFENAIDAIVRMIISIKGGIERTVKVPYGVPGDIVLPTPVPGSTLIWDEDGTALITGPTASAIANAEALVDDVEEDADRAEEAADRAEAAAAFWVLTEAQFQAAIRVVDGYINVSPALDEITLVSADVPYFQAAMHRICTFVETDVRVPAGVFTTTAGDIAHVSSHNANLRIIGADPIETTLSSVASVAGSAGDWDVVLNLADATGIAIGDVLKLFEVGPTPHVSGDNSVLLRARILPNELSMPVVNTGAITCVASTGSASFAGPFTYGPLSTFFQVNDLLHVKGQTVRVTAVNDGPGTLTITPGWSISVASERGFWHSIPNTGTIETSGSSTTVTGTGTAFTTEANVGDMLLAEGEMVEITAITDADTLTLAKAITLSAGTYFSIITPGVLHEGAHEVTNVVGNAVTVKNRSYVKPPVNKVTTGDAVAIKTVFKNTGTGDGLVFDQEGALAWLDNIAIDGDRTNSSKVGLAMNGRVSAGVFGDITQHGYRSSLLGGPNLAILDWGRNVFLGHGCIANLRMAAISGALSINLWQMEGSYANLRRAVIAGAASIGHAINAGAGALITEARFIGNGGDGMRRDNGGQVYGEIPFAWGNAGMGFRITGAGAFSINEGVSIGNLLSGLYFDRLVGGKIDRVLVGGNRREGVEATDAIFSAQGTWVCGNSGTAGNGNGMVCDGGRVNATGAALIGNKGTGLRATAAAYVDATSSNIKRNLVGSVLSSGIETLTVLASALLDLLTVAAGGVAHTAGATIVSSLVGVERVNEVQDNGSAIWDGAATAFGVNGLIIDGGSEMAFFKKGTVVFDFPSIPAHQYSSTTVAVSGVTTTGMTGNANSNSMDSALVISARVTASGTLTIFMHNVSAGALDPGNATLSWSVIG
jgi:hypothetical protein